MGVHEAYDKSSYGRFMMCVSRVQDDTMSAQDVCVDVFNILGYDGGRPCDNGNMRGRPCYNGNMHRDHTSKCRRPDLYRMFVKWSTTAPAVVKQEKTDVTLSRVPGPLPEGLRMGVYEAYEKIDYGHFMRRVVALQAGTISLQVADAHVFRILGYDGGKGRLLHDGCMDNSNPSRDVSSKSHRPDLYQMFVQWSTAAPGVVKEEKIDVALSRMLVPLPEGLRMAVYESYPALYGRFMMHVVALQEGTMPLKQVDDDVFTILGYDGGFHQKYGKYVVRDASCISHRPDLYRMFVDWSTATPPVVGNKKHKSIPFTFSAINIPAAPPETLCLDSLTSEVLVKDLIALEKAVHMTMSPTMQTALRIGLCAQGVPFSFGAMREMWLKELLKRVSFQKV